MDSVRDQVMLGENTTVTSNVVISQEKATGGATFVEGVEPKADAATFGDHTMMLISEEAANAANVGVENTEITPVTNDANMMQGSDISQQMAVPGEMNISQQTAVPGEMNIPQQMAVPNGINTQPQMAVPGGANIPQPGAIESDINLPAITDAAEDPKLSKGALVASILIGVVAALLSFAGVTYLLQM